MTDAHCHPYESTNTEDWIKGFREIGGTHLLCAGANLKTSQESIELSKKYPEIYAAIGIHPESTTEVPKPDEFLRLVGGKVVAIGECGLDYRPETTQEEKDFQKQLLQFNVDLAEKTGLPLVVHCRAAFDDLFATLHYAKVQMHCFTGNLDQMQECVKRGWYISFGGILTFKSSHELREVAKQVPADRILIETDAPYLAPEPIRGSVNTPANVKIVAETLARVRQISVQEVDNLTTTNFKHLFNL